MPFHVLRFSLAAAGAALLLCACSTVAPHDGPAPAHASRIASWQPRAGHARPVIAVVGAQQGTELSDFMVPYGILSDSGSAEVLALADEDGPLASFTDMGAPGFRIQAQATLAGFDAQHPEGADYVVVPALRENPAILAWLKAQAGKGATLVSICNGGMVVADTGIMAGRRATAHWSTEEHRMEHLSAVHWVKNARYVADGNWISSSGVSAGIPVSLALVEAIAGPARAHALAQELGVDAWSAQHDSDAFQLQPGTAWPLAKVAYTNRWLHGQDRYGIAATPGADEVVLALMADAWSSTGRSHAYLVGQAPLRTRNGLTILLDDTSAPEALLTVSDLVPGKTLDAALDGIAQRYGRSTARGVALVFEYPGFKD